VFCEKSAAVDTRVTSLKIQNSVGWEIRLNKIPLLQHFTFRSALNENNLSAELGIYKLETGDAFQVDFDVGTGTPLLQMVSGVSLLLLIVYVKRCSSLVDGNVDRG